MCFTPIVSISTAVIEWLMALVIFSFFRKGRLSNMFIAMLFFLGSYQFTEFMLCTTGNLVWVKLGFIAYTVLPALGLHSIMKYFNRKRSLIGLYAFPAAYILFALFNKGFAIHGECKTFFVLAENVLTNNVALWLPYLLYYSGFIIATFIILVDALIQTRNKLKREIEESEIIAILLMTVPTFVVILIFPLMGIMFPSILCHFAVLLAVFSFVGAYLENKLEKKRLKRTK